MGKNTFIVIGGVAAGMSAASKIRTIDTDSQITVFQKNGYVSYIACGIPYFIEGKIPSSSKLVAYDAQFFKEKRDIDVHLHHEAVKIFPSAKTVLVRNAATGEEKEYSYNRLLISTGATPVLLPIKGHDFKGIFSVRLLEDGIAIQDYMAGKSPKRGLIIGAGSIGLEMAEAFSERGLSVTVVEKMPDILGSMDDEINEVVEEELNNKGVTLLKSMGIVEFVGDSSGVKRAVLENGEAIDTDIVIIGMGIKPNVEIARQAGIELGQTGAIRVDEHMRTNLPDIYSAGDCAEAYHLVLGRNVYMPLGTTANKQGRVAGENMAGGKARFSGIVGTSIFKIFDLEVGRTGLTEKEAKLEGKDYVANVIDQFSRAHYYPGATKIRVKLLAENKTGRILGAQMVGKEGVAKRLDVFATALSTKMTVRELANLDLSYAPPFAPVYDPILIAGNELLKKLAG
ncbi:MAG: FAD-dependent oxidoreductase [Dehalococcoidales bacterium]|nr:FAD-dependent oxidoreductase [Dehalococcoidales bacterium]